MSEEEILSQDEMDELTGNGQEESRKEELYQAGEAIAYNFQQPEHTKRGHFPTLQLISEKTARELRDQLEFMLQQKVEVEASDITINKFGEFIHSLKIPIDIKRVHIPELNGSFLVCFDDDLMNVVIEEYFGAPVIKNESEKENEEKPEPESDEEPDETTVVNIEKEEFTNAESRISKKLLNYIMQSMQQGWTLIGAYHFTHQQTENNPRLINYLDHNDLIVNINYDIELRDEKCTIRIGMPYKILDKVKNKLRRTVQNVKESNDEKWTQTFYKKLQVIPMEMVSELGKITLPVKQLMELKKGDVINMPKPDGILIYANKVPILEGKIGEVNGQVAIKVNNWIKPNNSNE